MDSPEALAARQAAYSWHPTEDDLEVWARLALEEHYRRRIRRQTSRADFADGYIGGLLTARLRSAFREDTFKGWPEGD
jgi:hypothetical protein